MSSPSIFWKQFKTKKHCITFWYHVGWLSPYCGVLRQHQSLVSEWINSVFNYFCFHLKRPSWLLKGWECFCTFFICEQTILQIIFHKSAEIDNDMLTFSFLSANCTPWRWLPLMSVISFQSWLYCWAPFGLFWVKGQLIAACVKCKFKCIHHYVLAHELQWKPLMIWMVNTSTECQ